MMDVPPTSAVCLFKSITISPVGIVVKVMLCNPFENVQLVNPLCDVFSTRINGGASPTTQNAVPQETLF
jgi:hypothetical protein